MDNTILMQYEYIRREGRCNMLDRNCVQVRANDLGFFALVVVADNVTDYVAILERYERPDEDDFQQWMDAQEVTK